MKRFAQAAFGVTLLEIMLVLAIASLIIVMSVRYYQSASNNQLSVASFQQVSAAMAAMESVGNGYANMNTATLTSLMGPGNNTTPTGGAITVTAVAQTTYTITFVLNPSICGIVAARVQANPNVTTASCAAGTLTVSYSSTGGTSP